MIRQCSLITWTPYNNNKNKVLFDKLNTKPRENGYKYFGILLHKNDGLEENLVYWLQYQLVK